MKRSVILLVIVTFLAAGGASVASAEDVVLAKIGDKKITMGDYKRIVGYYDEDKQKALMQNPQFRERILKRLVQGAVLAKLAREKGFDKKADIREQIDLLTDDFLATAYVQKEVVDKIEASEEDMRTYYKLHHNDFRTPEMVRARHILLKVDQSSPDEEKEKAKEKAVEILKKLRDGEDLAKLASEFSEDTATRSAGGDLGFFRRGQMVPEFENAAFSLKPGEVSDIVETRYGFHILKVEEKRQASVAPYEKVREEVREKVQAQFRTSKVEEFFDKVMKDAGVEINTAPLMEMK